jgi:ribosomal protein L16 Arg81 hydroxylase
MRALALKLLPLFASQYSEHKQIVIQTSGAKEWRIGKWLITHQEEDERLIPNIDVRILRQGPTTLLEVTIIVLHPGDLLYLPPRVSHKGAALTNDFGH